MEFGPYQLVRKIGSGGMGEVWLAQHISASTGASRTVALKRLPPKLAHQERYRRILLEEARLSMMLSHSSIVHVFDAGEFDGEAFISMEYVDGDDLSRLLERLRGANELIPVSVIAYVIAEILRALTYAHELIDEHGETYSLVHRDISPHNVILSTSGEVKLTDFGVARLSSEDTSGTHVKGKIRYMPPEQLRGESRSPLVDLFATGAIMQELFDGEMFRGRMVEDAQLLGMVMDGHVPQPKQPRRIPFELDELRKALLQPDPRLRIPSARTALRMIYDWPRYRNASLEVADLVKRLRSTTPGPTSHSGPIPTDADSPAASTPSPSSPSSPPPPPPPPPPDFNTSSEIALARQDTFLHSDQAIVLESDLLAPLDEPSLAGPGTSPSAKGIKPADPIDPFPSLTQGKIELEDEAFSAKPRPAGLPTPAPRVASDPTPLPMSPRRPGDSTPDPAPLPVLEDGDSPADEHQPPPAPPPKIEFAESSVHRELELEPDLDAPDIPLAPPSTWDAAPTAEPSNRPSRGGRMLKAFILLALLGGLAAAAYFGRDELGIDCPVAGVGGDEDARPDDRRALILGDPFPAYSAFRHDDMQSLVDQGIEFRYAARHTYGKPLSTLADGDAEFVVTTLDQVLLERPAGKIVAVIDLSIGGDALVLDTAEFPALDELGDLPDKLPEGGARIALAGGTPSAYLALQLRGLLASLDSDQLRVDDGFEDARAVWAALEAESGLGRPVVAAVMWEPWVGQARDAGMHVVLSTRDLPRTIVDVLVASDRVLESDPELVDAVVSAYYTRVLAQQRDPDGLLDQVVRQSDLERAEAERALASVCVLDPFGAGPWMLAGGGEGDEQREAELALALDETWFTLERGGQVEGEPPTMADLVDAGPLEAAIAAANADGANADAANDDQGSREACLKRRWKANGTALGDLRLPLLDPDSGEPTPWFADGESELGAAAEPAVDELAEALREFNPASIRAEVVGYGDAKGSGRRLAKQRAQALVDALNERDLDLALSVHTGDASSAPPARVRVRLRRR